MTDDDSSETAQSSSDQTEPSEDRLSRRGALTALGGLGVLGLASQPVSAADDGHLGDTWSGDPGPHGLIGP